jgi:hypothetical protein
MRFFYRYSIPFVPHRPMGGEQDVHCHQGKHPDLPEDTFAEIQSPDREGFYLL